MMELKAQNSQKVIVISSWLCGKFEAIDTIHNMYNKSCWAIKPRPRPMMGSRASVPNSMAIGTAGRTKIFAGRETKLKVLNCSKMMGSVAMVADKVGAISAAKNFGMMVKARKDCNSGTNSIMPSVAKKLN